MDKRKRRMIEGWTDKASRRLQTAKDHFKGYLHYSEVIQDSQECIELSIKSILEVLEVEYLPRHGWTRDELRRIFEQVAQRKLTEWLVSQHLDYTVRLPRLVLLANMWSHFYLPAKYGIEQGHLAPAQDLFSKEEAELSIGHAEECCRAALALRYLPEDKLATMQGV